MHLPILGSALLSAVLVLDLVGAQSVVQILGASPRQKIDGFGSSIAFMGQAIEGLPSTARTAIINLLFSTSSGAGFSILRTRISPSLLNSDEISGFILDTTKSIQDK
jgi:glucuronoarabinoxylan endo-1,4-beta-xylanase